MRTKAFGAAWTGHQRCATGVEFQFVSAACATRENITNKLGSLHAMDKAWLVAGDKRF